MNFFQSIISAIQKLLAPAPAPKPAPKPTAPKPVSPAIAALRPNVSPATVSGGSAQFRPTPPPAPKPAPVSTPAPAPQQRGQSQPSAPSQPSPAQQSTQQARPVGSTTVPQGVSAPSTGSSAVTMPSSALPKQNVPIGTAKGIPLPDLSTPQAPSAQLNPIMPKAPNTISPEVINRLQTDTGANVPLTQQSTGYHPELDKGGAIDPIRRLSGQIQSSLGLSPAQQVHPIQHFIETMQRGGASKTEGVYDPSLGRTPGALTTQEGKPTNMATPENLGANITDPTLLEHAVTSVRNDPSKMQNVIPRIASPQGLQAIIKQQDQAQKTGDMQTVRTLANLHDGVTKQLELIDRIGRAILAQSKGFGTPNAPGVTEARMPIVQQGVGQQLTTPPPAPQASYGAPNQEVQMFSPRLPTAETQQNKPPVFPFMGR